jgi:hypothetical protein
VQDLSLLFEIGFENNFVGLFLSFAEDNGSAVPTAVDVDDVGDDGVTREVGAVDAEMLDSLGSFHLSTLDKVDEFPF